MRFRLAGCAAVLVMVGACGAPGDALVSADMIRGDAIPDPVGPQTGDAARGEAVFVAREGGHCVLCHRIDGLDAPFQGDVGPDLTGVGTRLTEGQIRLRVVDPTRVWPDTMMPAYYRVAGLNQVAKEHQGRPVLTAKEVEDVVAYLAALED